MLTIGLTGGIGSGKSTVAQLFAEQGIAIIDADQIAREVTAPQTKAYQAIVKHFGSAIIDENGQLQRRKLRDIIFKDNNERLWLEKLLHPLIRAAMQEKIKQVQSSYCILVIPLLIETLPNPLVKRILVVDTPEELQIKRTQQRDQLNSEQIKSIMQSQASRQARLQVADDIIKNDQDVAHLMKQVLQLHRQYLQLAKKES